jgi:predicted transcriptional regulator
MEPIDRNAELTAQIVSAYVSKNEVPRAELTGLIHDVYQALLKAVAAKHQKPAATPPADPAKTIKRTVFPSYLICLEDGKRFKSLKRHLRSAYGLTPEQYRAKWNLAADYPMVAPNYAEQRSTLAKKSGLGKKTKAK